MRAGLDDYGRSGWSLYQPYSLRLLARVSLDAGRLEEARAALGQALELAERAGQRCFDAELRLLLGELSLAADEDRAEAELHFSSALEVARRQGAPPLIERALASLERVHTLAD